jgi:dTDP-4-amino-4,6-dideoxygalactose transaminase
LLIPFNKPFLTGNELSCIAEALATRKLAGDGMFTKRCQAFFEERYGFPKTLLTTSCTDALEMSAILLDIQSGDEVIVPSYTFVSTVNAFVLRGAIIRFADSCVDHPNMDIEYVARLITPRTKAIVVVHYAGMSVDFDGLRKICAPQNIAIVEDAALGLESTYRGQPLGSLGDLAAFSFHETKNIVAGEGGLLVINNSKYAARAEIIREKGTNRSQFFRGEVNKYGWVDVGSSFLPSELIAAFLWAQLQSINEIQARRMEIWNNYFDQLQHLAKAGTIDLPNIPSNTTHNAHIFYLVCKNITERENLIQSLKNQGISASFHYQALHDSPYFKAQYEGEILPKSIRFSDCLLRLPIFVELSDSEQQRVIDAVLEFYKF